MKSALTIALLLIAFAVGGTIDRWVAESEAEAHPLPRIDFTITSVSDDIPHLDDIRYASVEGCR